MGERNLNNRRPVSQNSVAISKSVFNSNNGGGELGPGYDRAFQGAITLTAVGANNNGLGGIILDSDFTGAVTINNSLNPTLYSVKGNGEEGFVITTMGAVTV